MHRAIIHVDMDAFYASVEQRDDPALRGRPVIVGGHPKRGVVLAASYEVRPFGVRSAMPMAHAVRLAPHAVVVPPRFGEYTQASERVHAIFESVTPLVEPLSLDEAFLDVTGCTALFGPPAQIARTIRARIFEELRLPASAGIAAVKFVAKIASDIAKPNGQYEVSPEHTERFLAALPVARLWGVGAKTEQTLRTLGCHTVGDVAARDVASLEHALGSSGRHLWELSHGIDARAVVPDREAKSLGAEDTFEHDVDTPDALAPHLLSQALRVGRRLRRAGLKGRVVVLKLKFADFRLITRRTTLPAATDDGQALYRHALELLRALPWGQSVRLTGVSAHDLTAGEPQLALFDGGARRAVRLNAALDQIAERFGTRAVVPADLRDREPRDESLDEARRRAGAARFDEPAPGDPRRTPERS